MAKFDIEMRRDHDSYIHHLGLDISFDENRYHDFLQARLIEGIGYCKRAWGECNLRSLKSYEFVVIPNCTGKIVIWLPANSNMQFNFNFRPSMYVSSFLILDFLFLPCLH